MKKELLVHLHLYYENQLDYLILKLNNIVDCTWDLVVTVCSDNNDIRNKILSFKPDARILKVQNVGYDVYPFIEVIRTINLDDYLSVIKIHTKNTNLKSHFNNSFIDRLIGSERIFTDNINAFRTDKKLGIIFDKINQYSLKNDIVVYQDNYKVLLARLDLTDNEYNYYPMGTMFMIRACVLGRLAKLDISADDFSKFSETGSNCTMAHCLERIFAKLAVVQGYKVKANFTRKSFLVYCLNIILMNLFSIKNIYKIENKQAVKQKFVIILGIRFKILG